MPPDAIVMTFDVAENFRTSLFNRFKNAALDQFRLEPREKTFRRRVVVTIARRAH